MTNPETLYQNWTREELIARLSQLDSPRITRHAENAPAKRPEKSFDFASYSKRKIALKFCYSGWEYNGLAHQLGPTPLPTVEGTLFDALSQARLVDPEAGFDGCGFERCGRTDRGVSAAGQVVSLWVRSALKAPPAEPIAAVESTEDASTDEPSSEGLESVAFAGEFGMLEDLADTANTSVSAQPKPECEFRYVSMLNRLLPPTIRVLAWSPVAPDFSSRFACRFRHYKYLFGSEGLDIARMRDAADRLVGEHDFRNLCKLDPAKQITSFRRRILRADISQVDGTDNLGGLGGGTIYVLDLMGTAFLYHQVRHIMAILFLVGSGLEKPSVMSALLNVEPGLESMRSGDESLEVVDSKPEYQMADGLPLMLWDCAYADSDVQWQTDGESVTEVFTKTGAGSSLYYELDSILARSRTHTILDSHFLAAAAQFHNPPTQPFPLRTPTALEEHGTFNIPLGGGTHKRTAKYVPLLQRKRLDKVEVANERWRIGKGSRRDERRKAGNNEEDGGDE